MSDPSGIAVIIGGGPSGLMAAETLLDAGAKVHVYDAMPSAGRKMLVAGKGGLNLTHSEPLEQFLSHYRDHRPHLEPLLKEFGPDEVRAWAEGLGVKTFIGTSARVFPVGMKSFPLLHNWLARLRASGMIFHARHLWTGWHMDGSLCFSTPEGEIKTPAGSTVLALGGGSWPQTGSTGLWVSMLTERGIHVAPLKPSNCGFDVAWSNHFRARFAGFPLKSLVLSFIGTNGKSFHQQGELIITKNGVEGSLIYACSQLLREEIESSGIALIHIDLAPGWTRERLIERLSRPQGSRSSASHLDKSVGIRGIKAGLLWEYVPKAEMMIPEVLAGAIKDLAIPLLAARPLRESISSAGGVDFSTLDGNLMLRALPGVFCAGEMLDWEAPTGGYLLTACLSTGHAAGCGAYKWLLTAK